MAIFHNAARLPKVAGPYLTNFTFPADESHRFAREIYGLWRQTTKPITMTSKMTDLPVKELMSRDLVVIRPGETLVELERLFLAYNIHHLPVVDASGKLCGLVSKTDMYKARAEGGDTATVEDIMTKQVATAVPDTPLREVADVFLSNILHAMPIVDHGELLGLVTAQDVLRYCLNERKLLEE